MVAAEGRRVARDELHVSESDIDVMTPEALAYTAGQFHVMKHPQHAVDARDWEWRLCTEVIAHAMDQKGVVLRVSADTKTRLRAIQGGTDDSFMSPEELVDLAPKTGYGADWKTLTGMNSRQLTKLWGRTAFPEDTTLAGLTRQFPDAGIRVARVLWTCAAKVAGNKDTSKRTARRQKAAGIHHDDDGDA